MDFCLLNWPVGGFSIPFIMQILILNKFVRRLFIFSTEDNDKYFAESLSVHLRLAAEGYNV